MGSFKLGILMVSSIQKRSDEIKFIEEPGGIKWDKFTLYTDFEQECTRGNQNVYADRK